MFRTLILMRGIPGSGKSTVARLVASSSENQEITRSHGYRFKYGVDSVILSTDFYFIGDDGEYRFNPAKIGDNHRLNQECCKTMMLREAPTIIIDNTNTQVWEMMPYVKLAKEHCYKIVVMEVPHPPLDVAASRNSHGVPLEALKRMVDRWESDIPNDWNDHPVVKVS